MFLIPVDFKKLIQFWHGLDLDISNLALNRTTIIDLKTQLFT